MKFNPENENETKSVNNDEEEVPPVEERLEDCRRSSNVPKALIRTEERLENDNSKDHHPTTGDDKNNIQPQPPPPPPPRSIQFLSRMIDFWDRNQFPILILLSVLVAKAYPPLGADYLQPDITATWIAVVIIFLISGACLKLEEFAKAFQRLYFNVFVQVFNFGVVSIFVFGLSRFLELVGAINSALADGMVICSCLPMAINVVIVLTTAAGGDEAAAVFNTTFGNIIGIFLSPALILGYLGTSGDITLPQIFLSLTLRVVLPLTIGLALRTVSDRVAKAVTCHKKKLKRTQEYSLVFIVYTVFCHAFEEGMDVGLAEILLTALIQFLLLVSLMWLSWISLEYLGFKDDPKLRVMAVFGCTGKTISLGVPLINAIYEHDPQRGLYTLPLLIWHPLQLLVGSYLTTRLGEFIENEEQRLLQEENDLSAETPVADPEMAESDKELSAEAPDTESSSNGDDDLLEQADSCPAV